jgi:hypothetical protein
MAISLVEVLVSQRYKKIIHIKYLILSQSFAGEKIIMLNDYIFFKELINDKIEMK